MTATGRTVKLRVSYDSFFEGSGTLLGMMFRPRSLSKSIRLEDVLLGTCGVLTYFAMPSPCVSPSGHSASALLRGASGSRGSTASTSRQRVDSIARGSSWGVGQKETTTKPEVLVKSICSFTSVFLFFPGYPVLLTHSVLCSDSRVFVGLFFGLSGGFSVFFFGGGA